MKRLTVILGASAVACVLAIAPAVLFSPYRMERAAAYLDPWDAPGHTSEQLAEALIAFGRS